MDQGLKEDVEGTTTSIDDDEEENLLGPSIDFISNLHCLYCMSIYNQYIVPASIDHEFFPCHSKFEIKSSKVLDFPCVNSRCLIPKRLDLEKTYTVHDILATRGTLCQDTTFPFVALSSIYREKCAGGA